MDYKEVSDADDNKLPVRVHSQWYLMQAVEKGEINDAERNEIVSRWRDWDTDINLSQIGTPNPNIFFGSKN